MSVGRPGSPWSANVFGVLSAVRASKLLDAERCVVDPLGTTLELRPQCELGSCCTIHTWWVNDYPTPTHHQQEHTAANFAALHRGNIWLRTSPNRLSTPFRSGKGGYELRFHVSLRLIR
ncbi:hypothetical protein AVEN_25622-1 [Araneus ventricosus]|uniref:Uncharacterized protein n=1 Tax=Araneus ventricosus TaxID=182803 RepID=A0A4Y2BNV2_ARAVE|nr:hypothetical protein AVEN_25622-1 [Araneus ventricosus]